MAIEAVYSFPDDYDLELSARDDDDVAFWQRVSMRERPSALLEVGCGTGRVTLPLARLGARFGFSVTGVDAEAPMLERARERRATESTPVKQALRLVHADVRSLDLRERFGAVLLPCGVAHHWVEVDEQLAALAVLRRHAAPGALLVADLSTPNFRLLARAEGGVPRHRDLHARGGDGRVLERTVSYHYEAERQHLLHAYRYARRSAEGGWTTYPSDFTMHVYFPREVELLCRMSGFRVERMEGGFGGEPFSGASRHLLVYARAV